MGCDALLFGTMGNIGPAVHRSLESHGLRVVGIGFSQNVFRDEFGYRRALSKAVGCHQPSKVFPIGDPLALARYKSSLPDGTAAVVEDEEKINLLGQKVPFSRLMSEMGIRQPCFYHSPEEADGKDVIFKRNISFGGHGVHRPRNADSIRKLIDHQPAGEPYLIEDYIEGEDFSVDAVRFDGYFRASAYKALTARGSNGPSTSRETVSFPELEITAKMIMDRLDYKGVCGFDFKVDKDGTPFILECNPRFTGGIENQIESGFDIPYILWKKS